MEIEQQNPLYQISYFWQRLFIENPEKTHDWLFAVILFSGDNIDHIFWHFASRRKYACQLNFPLLLNFHCVNYRNSAETAPFHKITTPGN